MVAGTIHYGVLQLTASQVQEEEVMNEKKTLMQGETRNSMGELPSSIPPLDLKFSTFISFRYSSENKVILTTKHMKTGNNI